MSKEQEKTNPISNNRHSFLSILILKFSRNTLLDNHLSATPGGVQPF